MQDSFSWASRRLVRLICGPSKSFLHCKRMNRISTGQELHILFRCSGQENKSVHLKWNMCEEKQEKCSFILLRCDSKGEIHPDISSSFFFFSYKYRKFWINFGSGILCSFEISSEMYAMHSHQCSPSKTCNIRPQRKSSAKGKQDEWYRISS